MDYLESAAERHGPEGPEEVQALASMIVPSATKHTTGTPDKAESQSIQPSGQGIGDSISRRWTNEAAESKVFVCVNCQVLV